MTLSSIEKGARRFPLYFDYQSTTPCATEVLEAMMPYWSEHFGNPSSKQSRSAIYASAAIDLAREELASYFCVHPNRLIFTSGATESNNLALLGYARAKALTDGEYGHIITLTTEHNSVLDPLSQLEEEGFRVTKLNPCPDGLINFEQFQDSIQEDTFLVSIMVANNEIGVVQPISKISNFCKEKGIIFHTDAAQAFGNIPLEKFHLFADFITISSHKIYGPKGIGALIKPEHIEIQPLQWGGGQQMNLRPGTLPVPLIIGFHKAADIAIKDLSLTINDLEEKRNMLLNGIQKMLPNIIINGSMDKRLPHNINVTISGVNGASLHRNLRPYIECSNASACSNGEVSHVLKAIGRSSKEAESSLRLSVGRYTTKDEIGEAIDIISNVIRSLK